MDSQKTNIGQEVTDAIKDQADSFIDDVKEELIEAKESFIEEVKNTILGLGNSVFGDLGLLLSIIRTIGIWFIRPISLNVREIERQNIVRLGEGKKIRYFTDFNLMKSIFMLSLTFLVVEEAVAHASQDHWIDQVVFFMFFVGLLFLFIGLMWLWKVFLNFNTGDSRVFISFIIYQYATIYIVSFLVYGPFGIEITDDRRLAIYGFQVLHSVFFLGHLIKYYQLQKWRKVVGWILGFAFMAFLVFFPQIITEVFLTEQ